MIRLFVGLALPEAVRERLAALCSGLPRVRWVAPESMHVTLRFIGEIDEALAGDVDAALSQVRAPAFSLDFAGVGTFGSARKPHALWVGVEKAPALVHLRDKIESGLVRAGLPPEPRKFSPHVTLARLKESPGARLVQFMERNGSLQIPQVGFDRFILYSSHLGRNGASYQIEAEYPLV